MCTLKRFRTLWILLQFIQLLHCWRNYECRFESYRYELSDKKYFADFHFALVPLKHRKAMSGRFTLVKPVSEFQVEFSVYVPRAGNGSANLIDTTFNGCEVLNSKGANLLKILVSQIRKTTRGYFPQHCPVEANKTFSLDNFYIDAEKFPPYVPEMVFMANFHLITGGEYVLKSFVNGTVVTKKKKKKRTYATRNNLTKKV